MVAGGGGGVLLWYGLDQALTRARSVSTPVVRWR